jgi:hypothetical protein
MYILHTYVATFGKLTIKTFKVPMKVIDTRLIEALQLQRAVLAF